MTSVTLLRDLISLGITFGLTGWLLGLVLVRGRLGGETRILLSLALAVPATVLVAAPGLFFHELGLATFLPCLALLAALAAWRSGFDPAHLRRALAGSQKGFGRIGWPRFLALSAAVLVGWFAVLGPQLAAQRPDGLPNDTSPWFYLWLVQRVVEEGGFPTTNPEWGAERSFHLVYLVTTSHTAAAAELGGGADLAFVERYAFVLIGLALVAAYALWRRWLPGWWAWIAAVLTMSAALPMKKFLDYRPETFGLVLVFWSSWMLDEAFDRRSPRWAALAGFLSASAFLAHAEAWVLTGPIWLGIVAGRLGPYLWSRSRSGSPPNAGEGERRRPWPDATAALRVVAVCAGAFFISVAVLAIGTGGGGHLANLAGLISPQNAASPGSTEAVAGGKDQSWVLYAAMRRPQRIDRPPPDLCGNPIVSRVREPYSGLDLKDPLTLSLLGAAGLVLLGALPFLPAAARRCVLTWLVFGIGLSTVSSTVCSVYDTYVPARAGPTRILPYLFLALAGLLTVLGYLVSTRTAYLLGRLFGRERARSSAPTILTTLVFSAALLLFFTPVASGELEAGKGDPEEGSISPVAYDAYRWMDRHLPADSVVLANSRTKGTIGSIAGSTGWLDGRAPYQESWTPDAIQALLNARAYYKNPQSPGGDPPPSVDYVLAAQSDVNLGGDPTFPTDMEALRQEPGLRLVREFGDGDLLLFEAL